MEGLSDFRLDALCELSCLALYSSPKGFYPIAQATCAKVIKWKNENAVANHSKSSQCLRHF